MPVLTAIDTLGLQRYIFSSNRLRDVVAASWAVDKVTSASRLLQLPGAAALSREAVLLSAGGNASIEFSTLEAAHAWTAHYTRWVGDEAPGLEIAIAHHSYSEGGLAEALEQSQRALVFAKLRRRPSTPQLGLSVTASCTVTGLPATLRSEDGELLSPGVGRMRETWPDAKDHWASFLPQLPLAPGAQLAFPDELDRMGRSEGDLSQIGVVHIDGNDVGGRIQRWLEHCRNVRVPDAEVRAQCRAWSAGLNELGRSVLRAMVEQVVAAVQVSDRGYVLAGAPSELGFPLHTEREVVWLPLRPILLGGDDFTFVCDGRIALSLAARALQVFREHSIAHLGERGDDTHLSACAGVALGRAHAPFHRSYELAAALCESAKSAKREAGPRDGSWLDWHVGATRPGETVQSIRQRQYKMGQGADERRLTLRPYPLDAASGRTETWSWLEEELLGSSDSAKGLRGEDGWLRSRNRVKDLRRLAWDGERAIERQLAAWNVSLPGGLASSGFRGAGTPLLDAIELLDVHLRLATTGGRGRSPAKGSGC